MELRTVENSAKGIPASQDEIDTMREVIAYALVMLMVCPVDTDATKTFQAATDLFKGSIAKLAKLEHANGRQADLDARSTSSGNNPGDLR